MARYPGGRWTPIPENATQAKITPTQVILHTAVDAPGPTNLGRYFARADITVECHFWITLDGTVYQFMDTEVRADANYQASARAISIETEDEGDPVGIPWTAAQLDSIVAVIRWASATHGIPLRVCPDPLAPGLGFHSMFGSPSPWTPYKGKTCPGPTRVRQFHETVIPRLTRPVALLQEEPDTMTMTEARNAVLALYTALLGRVPSEAELNYWASYGVTNGRLSLLWAFIEAAATEIWKVRNALTDRVLALESLPRGEASSVDVDAVTEKVASAIIDRLKV